MKKSYEKLLKKKDDIEISVYINLVGLIIGKQSVIPSEVEKAIRTFDTLKKNMATINLEKVSQNQAKNTRMSILKIMENIDPKFSKNEELVKNYSHLFSFAKWVIATSELILNMCAQPNLEANCGVREKLVLISYRDYLVTEKMILNANNSVSEESDSIMKIRDNFIICLNDNKEVLQKNETFIKIINSGRLSDLNANLNCENSQITDLYKYFEKSKIPSVHRQEHSIYKNTAAYFCNSTLCGYLNCLKKNPR